MPLFEPMGIMETNELLAEIRRAYPVVEMPKKRGLRFHAEGCVQCQYLSDYLDEHRGQPIDGEIIRYMHQEMSCLSAAGWAWALPHYLPFCLTPEAEYNQMETEFLIYGLGPRDEHKTEAKERLSALSDPQIDCLKSFLGWLSVHPKWSEYCPEDISRAERFLDELST
jgi:hypothetical protein